MNIVELGEITDDARPGFASGESEDDGIMQVRMNNVATDGALIWDKVRRVPRPKKIDDLLVLPGDILFNATNSPELVGKSALFSGHDEPVTFSNHFIRLRLNKSQALPDYVVRFIHIQWEKRIFENNCKRWVNQASVSKSDLLALRIPLPPIEEQKRIAAILDQADSLRRLRHRAIDCLNTLGQAIFYEMFGDPATNPLGFKSHCLGELIDFIGGSQPAKSNFLYEDGPERIRFIQIRDFRTDEYKTYVPKHLAKRPFDKDDVMIGRYGPPVFQIFRGLSGTYNVALMKAEPKRDITNDFVFYLLQEHKLHSYVVANSERTAGQSGVNLRLLESYPAYKPPIDLQLEFSERISELDGLLIKSAAHGRKTDYLFSLPSKPRLPRRAVM